MISKLIPLFMFGLLLTDSAYSQRKIYGLVTDTDNNPLPGATLQIEESPTLGAVTNLKGEYELQLPDNKYYTLKAKYLGYVEASRQLYDTHNKTINFRLEENKQVLHQMVVTGTRTPKLLKDAPIVTRVITAEDIKRTDATNLAELLQTELPGIELAFSMNQQTTLNMAGFGGNSVLFLVDGERLAGETLDNVDYSRLNLDNVQRVEIIKGAASSLYGSHAVGGVVNIITKEANEPWSVNINGRYSAHNEQRYGASVGIKQGQFNSLTHVQHTSIDAIDLTRGRSPQTVGDYSSIYGNSTLNVKERLIYNACNRLKLTARAGYFFRERNSSPTQEDRYRSFTGGLKGNYRLTGKDDWELSYAFDQYDKSDYLVLTDRDVRDYSNVQHIVRTLYNHTFAGKHVLTLGGDYIRDYLMSYQFANGGSHTQHSADAFAQFDWSPHKRINVIAATRFDYFSEAKLSRLSPKLGIMYKFDNCSLRASYSSGFRAPTLKEMYMNFYMGK